jgi:type II secretory pathway component PulJ
MRLRDEERGVTLVEFVVAMALGMVVLIAVFGLVEATQRSSSRITQRIDAAQRGRIAMEQMTQSLRSLVCVQPAGDAAPSLIASGDGSQVTVYAAIQGGVAGQAAPSPLAPQRRQYRYDAAANMITETVAPGVGTMPALSFPTTRPARTVLADVAAPSGATVFSYYTYKADGTIDPTPLAVPLTDATRNRVVRIGVNFVSRPTGGSKERAVQAPFQNVVSVRRPLETTEAGVSTTCAS